MHGIVAKIGVRCKKRAVHLKHLAIWTPGDAAVALCIGDQIARPIVGIVVSGLGGHFACSSRGAGIGHMTQLIGARNVAVRQVVLYQTRTCSPALVAQDIAIAVVVDATFFVVALQGCLSGAGGNVPIRQGGSIGLIGIHRVEAHQLVVAVGLDVGTVADALGLLGNEADVARVLRKPIGVEGHRSTAAGIVHLKAVGAAADGVVIVDVDNAALAIGRIVKTQGVAKGVGSGISVGVTRYVVGVLTHIFARIEEGGVEAFDPALQGVGVVHALYPVVANLGACQGAVQVVFVAGLAIPERARGQGIGETR